MFGNKKNQDLAHPIEQLHEEKGLPPNPLHEQDLALIQKTLRRDTDKATQRADFPGMVSRLATQLEQNPFHEKEQAVLQKHMRLDVEEAMARIDFGAMNARLTAQIAAEEAPRQTVPLRPESWLQRWRSRLQAHPGFSFGLASACALACLFFLPSQQTPNKVSHAGVETITTAMNAVNDCVVDKVDRTQTTQVAVLQTKTQAGQQMTVIVIDGPPADPEPDTKEKANKD